MGLGKQYQLSCKLGNTGFTGEFSWFKDNAEIPGTKSDIKANQENDLSYTVSYLVVFIGKRK